MGKSLLTVGSLKGAVCILKAIGNNYKIGSYGIMHTVQGAVLSSFLETLFSSSFSQFWHESLACSLCWALLFSGPQTSHISNKLHLFCKTCSFSPNLHVLRHMHHPQQKLFLLEAASPPSSWALLPLTSHSPCWLGKERITFFQKRDSILVSLPGASPN